MYSKGSKVNDLQKCYKFTFCSKYFQLFHYPNIVTNPLPYNPKLFWSFCLFSLTPAHKPTSSSYFHSETIFFLGLIQYSEELSIILLKSLPLSFSFHWAILVGFFHKKRKLILFLQGILASESKIRQPFQSSVSSTASLPCDLHRGAIICTCE